VSAHPAVPALRQALRALNSAADALALRTPRSDYSETYWRLRDAARDVEATLDALTTTTTEEIR
jgi:hypothetical protein